MTATIQTLTQHYPTELPAAFVEQLTSTPQFVAGIGWLALNTRGAVCYAMTAAKCARLIKWTSGNGVACGKSK